MKRLRKLGRLFTIKTRLEAFLVTYAIAVGAVERGLHYTQQIPGNMGWLLAACCLGVPFIAGAKLIDSVKPLPSVATPVAAKVPPRRRAPRHFINRNRSRGNRRPAGSASQP